MILLIDCKLVAFHFSKKHVFCISCRLASKVIVYHVTTIIFNNNVSQHKIWYLILTPRDLRPRRLGHLKVSIPSIL